MCYTGWLIVIREKSIAAAWFCEDLGGDNDTSSFLCIENATTTETFANVWSWRKG
jgi:hypothetical protein